jgi:hypothetical protein
MTELERLSELEKRATAGRWYWNSYSAIFTIEFDPEDERAVVGHVRVLSGDTAAKPDDAAFIVDARNAFPHLLAVARAAEKWAEGKGDPRTLVDDLERAVAALSALAGKEKP